MRKPAALRVTDLTVGYGESRVIHDLCLQINPGEVVCLMGRNGVGKSTLVKSIVGLLPARGGSVEFDSRDFTRAEPHVRAHAGLAYVPQGRGIFPQLTVWENLLMGFEASRGVDDAAIDEVYGAFPALRDLSRRVAGVLSGGQQQQLAIGRALVSRPRLLVLDEPTEGIQPSIVDQIETVVGALRATRGTSVLLVEQFLDFALAVADRYYVMASGTIVAQGASSQLSDHTVKEHLSV